MARTTYNKLGRTRYNESSLERRKAVLGSSYRFKEADEDDDDQVEDENVEDEGAEDDAAADEGDEMISVPKSLVDEVKDLLTQLSNGDEAAADDDADADADAEDFDDFGEDEGDEDFSESVKATRKAAYLKKRIQEARADKARRAIAEARMARNRRIREDARRSAAPARRAAPLSRRRPR